MYNGERGASGAAKTEEGDAGEAEPAAGTEHTPAPAQSSSEDLRRELRDGPLPGPTAMKGSGVALEKILLDEFGGDPERDIHEKIMLSED